MAVQTPHFNELRELLTSNRRSILSVWVKGLASIPQVDLLKLEESDLREVAVECLDQMLADLESPANGDILPSCFFNLINQLRSDPVAPVEVLWVFRKAVLPYIQATPVEKQVGLTHQLDEYLFKLIIRLIRRSTNELQERTKQTDQRTTMITDIVNLVSSTLDLGEVLTQAGQAIAIAAGADYCFFYLIDAESEEDLWVFTPPNLPLPEKYTPLPSGMKKMRANFLSPDDALWQVLSEKRPVSIYDAQNAPNTTHGEALQKSGAKSFLLVPCLAKGDVSAVAVVMTFDDHRNFSTEEINLALAIATVVAPAIENARLYQKVEQLAAIEERARLARAMHDSFAQTLSALQMKASQTGELLLKQQIQAATDAVNELAEIARQAYTDVREAIFNLRARVPGGKDFVPYLHDYLATYQACFGIKTILEVEGSPTANLTGDSADQIMFIIQEALTNIRKHAFADLVQIRLEKINNMLQIDVLDNGTGFDFSIINQKQDWNHLGLQIMQERAVAVGGTVKVDSLPGRGTRVRITVPMMGEVFPDILAGEKT